MNNKRVQGEGLRSPRLAFEYIIYSGLGPIFLQRTSYRKTQEHGTLNLVESPGHIQLL